jgi:hypothetical protein
LQDERLTQHEPQCDVQHATQPAREYDDPSQWLLTGNLPCLGCQYNMRGLVGPLVQCPECGHTNDLARPQLWETSELPLGIRERQHWPATAGLVSLLVLLSGFFVVVAIMGGGLISPGFIIALLICAAFVVLWLWNCKRFIASCTNALWGLKIILGVHIGTWCLLWAGGVMFYPTMDILFNLLAKLLPAAVGVAAFLWTRKQLQRGEDQAAYRIDWRKWRLPTGAAVDMRSTAHRGE